MAHTSLTTVIALQHKVPRHASAQWQLVTDNRHLLDGATAEQAVDSLVLLAQALASDTSDFQLEDIAAETTLLDLLEILCNKCYDVSLDPGRLTEVLEAMAAMFTLSAADRGAAPSRSAKQVLQERRQEVKNDLEDLVQTLLVADKLAGATCSHVLRCGECVVKLGLSEAVQDDLNLQLRAAATAETDGFIDVRDASGLARVALVLQQAAGDLLQDTLRTAAQRIQGAADRLDLIRLKSEVNVTEL